MVKIYSTECFTVRRLVNSAHVGTKAQYLHITITTLTVFKEQHITPFSWLWSFSTLMLKQDVAYVRWILSQSDLKINLHSCFVFLTYYSSSNPSLFSHNTLLVNTVTSIHPAHLTYSYAWLHPVNKEQKKWAWSLHIPHSLCYFCIVTLLTWSY